MWGGVHRLFGSPKGVTLRDGDGAEPGSREELEQNDYKHTTVECKCKCNFFTHGASAPRSSQELVQKCPFILGSNWNLEMLVFKEGKNQSTGRKTSRSSPESIERTTNSTATYDAGFGNGTRDTLLGGERPRHYAIRHPSSHNTAILMRKILGVNLRPVNREELESKLSKGP